MRIGMIRNSVDVVNALGGYHALSRALKLNWRTIYNWTRPEREYLRTRGITLQPFLGLKKPG
jgi:hypothetical protein